jgi:hypothetical protein
MSKSPKTNKANVNAKASAKFNKAKLESKASSKRLPKTPDVPPTHKFASGYDTTASYYAPRPTVVERSVESPEKSNNYRLVKALREHGLNLVANNLGDTTMFYQDNDALDALREKLASDKRTDALRLLDSIQSESGERFDPDLWEQAIEDRSLDAFYRMIVPREEDLESDPSKVGVINITPNKGGGTQQALKEFNRLSYLYGLDPAFNFSSYWIGDKATAEDPFMRSVIKTLGRQALTSNLNKYGQRPLGDFTLYNMLKALFKGEPFNRDTVLGPGSVFDSILRGLPNEEALRARHAQDASDLEGRAAVLRDFIEKNPVLKEFIRVTNSGPGLGDSLSESELSFDDETPVMSKSADKFAPRVGDIYLPLPVDINWPGPGNASPRQLFITPSNPKSITDPNGKNYFRGGNVSFGKDQFYLSKKSPNGSYRINEDLPVVPREELARIKDFPSIESLNADFINMSEPDRNLILDFYNDLARKVNSRNSSMDELNSVKGKYNANFEPLKFD